MIHADLALAARLERAAAEQSAACVAAHRRLFSDSSAAWIPFGTGIAAFLDESSPLTQVRGAGLTPPGSEAEIDEVEEFFESRMAPVSFVLTPFADPALFTYLSRRGYEIGAFENTLVRRITANDIGDDPDVEVATDECEWAGAMAEAFFESVTGSGIVLGRTLHALPTVTNLLVRAEGAPAAGAQVDVRNGLAMLQCDGTRRAYRGVGLQKKLIRARLALAARAGCDLAAAETQPGSISQRNYELLGFRLAYTRITLIKPCL